MATTTAELTVRATDGVPLKVKLRRTERRRKLAAVGLVLPLFLFVIVTFVAPIGVMLFNAVHDDDLKRLAPNTIAALATWDGKNIPDEAAFAALAQDLKESWKEKTAALIGKRMNYELPGIRSQVTSSAKAASTLEAGPYKEALVAINPVWGQLNTWAVLKRGASAFTPYYLLRALDFQYDADNQIVPVPTNVAIFRDITLRRLAEEQIRQLKDALE